LYNYEYKKKYRSKRIGILWSLPIISIYTHKCDISKGWTSKESNVIAKIEEISINLYNELRRKIIKDNPDKFERANKETVDKHDGLNYILNFVPVIDNNSRTDIISHISKPKEEIRHISY
jgi:hypothetical protein